MLLLHNKKCSFALEMDFPNILFISSDSGTKTLVAELKPLLDAGLKWYQLRLKDKNSAQILEAAATIKPICAAYNCLFTLNDYPNLAIQSNANGLHIGKTDGDPIELKKILSKNQHLGVTCNNGADVQYAIDKKVDYIGLGPYQFTRTKKNLAPTLGINGYKEILQNLSPDNLKFPIVAIGGLNLEAVVKLKSVGINHFAFSSHFTGKDGAKNFKKIQDYVGK